MKSKSAIGALVMELIEGETRRDLTWTVASVNVSTNARHVAQYAPPL
jgi:hypothetical protein